MELSTIFKGHAGFVAGVIGIILVLHVVGLAFLYLMWRNVGGKPDFKDKVR